MSTARDAEVYRFALSVAAAALATALWSAPVRAGTVNKQTAELYQLQAAFHRAATVHDPVNGDSAEVIDQRIREMLALWTDDGSVTLAVGGAHDGNYSGQGDPSDPSTCPAPSGNPTNRGTLCTLFKYVAGSFQPAKKFVSLAPSYKTAFGIQGKTATVYFECHYFNVAIDPTTGLPLWKAASHLVFDGSAEKTNGAWLFSHANSPVAGIPIP
jgi:hypothetical protein